MRKRIEFALVVWIGIALVFGDPIDFRRKGQRALRANPAGRTLASKTSFPGE